MKRSFLLFFAFTIAAAAQNIDASADRIRAHTKILSSDLFEGRGLGARGGALSSEYIASQFAVAGARPAGDNGTYLQKVPLVGVDPQPEASSLTIVGREQSFPLKWMEEYVGTNQKQTALEDFDAEAVFVGFGISAPEYNWDDFKGVDVRGKVIVLFTNEPESNDPKFFGGRALTFYGRWVYKYEEATRRGALGAIIIHTTPTATYGFDVVQTAWGAQQAFPKLAPGAHALSFAGWVTTEAGNRLLAMSGHNVDELLKASNSRDFKPFPLNFRVKAKVASKIHDLDTSNVVAMIPGSDPALKDQAVVFMAHADHFGIGRPVNGDSIYNGAIDNATGVAMIIEIARAWASLPQKPKRTAIFVATTAEEAGLLGASYYVEHAPVPPGKTAAVLNFDSYTPAGRQRGFGAGGAERTTLWPVFVQTAKQFGYDVPANASGRQSSFLRTDLFAFARAGVPSTSVTLAGESLAPPELVAKVRKAAEGTYHQPSDEYHDFWDFSGLEDLVRFATQFGANIANLDKLPTWNPGDEYLPAREKSM